MVLLASILSKMIDNKAYTFGVSSIYNIEKDKLEEKLKRKRKLEDVELEEKEIISQQELIKKNDIELKKKLQEEFEYFNR